MNSQINIERTVIASYLLLNDTDDGFKDNARVKLDINSFILPFHKRVVEQINKALDNNMPLPYLLCLIQDKIINTADEMSLLEIESTNPIDNKSGLNWYIKHLIENKIAREFGDGN